MKRFLTLFFLLGLLLVGFGMPVAAQSSTQEVVVEARAWDHSDIVSFEEVDKGQFESKWVLRFRQPVDHANPASGDFEQRVIVCWRGADRPVVLVTEGYGADYALRSSYTDELGRALEANVIVVEHRYFGPSTPQPRNWNYLTVDNAMHDLHHINTILRNYFSGKWIATGISKGGMTTMMYNTWYPDDADIWVPYVAPLNFGVEDGRHERFIEHFCGTADEREQVLAFQREALQRREEIRPLFEKWCSDRKLEFRVPLDEAYDLCVLEYSFAFWQWGTPLENIPAAGAFAQTVLNHLMTIAGADYFAIDDQPSFYVQAARELGYYGYDVKPFKGLLSIKTAKGYLHRVMLPEDAQDIRFSGRTSRRILNNLRKNDPRMIFIYGEFDPWSASAVDPKLFRDKRNMMRMVEPGGSHRARIGTLPAEQQQAVWNRINEWLNE